jgi:hypothetical protein
MSNGTLPPLKPCPFCGSPAKANHDVLREDEADPNSKAIDIYWVKCVWCGTQVRGFRSTLEEAVSVWNERKGA